MRILYLSYEIKSREIHFLREIAYKTIKTKAADIVYIGNKYIIFKLATLGLLIPGVIFIKSAQKYLNKKLKRMKENGFKIVLQDAESVCDLYKETMDYDMFMKHPDSLKFIETIYTARTDENNCLKKYDKICRAKKIGFLRFSYLLNKNYFRKIYGDEINKIQQEYGKHILILTSSTVYKFPHSGNKSFKGSQGMNEERFKLTMDWANYSHKNLFSICEFIRVFSEKSKGIKIIFRPHPSESKEFYCTLFNGIDNVIVENNFSIHASLAAANSIILPPISTTSFEAAIMEKEIFYLMPKSRDELDLFIRNHITTKLGTIYDDPISLHKAITTKKIKKDINKLLKNKKLIATNFINLTEDTLLNFCDDIKNIFLKESYYFKKSVNKKLKFQDLIIKATSYLFSFYTNLFFNKKKFSYLNYKLKGFKYENDTYMYHDKAIKRTECGIFEKFT